MYLTPAPLRSEEWGAVADFLWDAREELRGVALLGWFGDSAYDNAPLPNSRGGE